MKLLLAAHVAEEENPRKRAAGDCGDRATLTGRLLLSFYFSLETKPLKTRSKPASFVEAYPAGWKKKKRKKKNIPSRCVCAEQLVQRWSAGAYKCAHASSPPAGSSRVSLPGPKAAPNHPHAACQTPHNGSETARGPNQ